MLFPAAKVIVRHPEDPHKILMIKRIMGDIFFYEPAGGRIEVDFDRQHAETLEACAIREAHEELGIVVTIERYVGSYYFFWRTDPSKGSSCAVFMCSIVGQYNTFAPNADITESPIEPAWVSLNDIKSNKIPIDAAYVGLKEILVNIK